MRIGILICRCGHADGIRMAYNVVIEQLKVSQTEITISTHTNGNGTCHLLSLQCHIHFYYQVCISGNITSQCELLFFVNIHTQGQIIMLGISRRYRIEFQTHICRRRIGVHRILCGHDVRTAMMIAQSPVRGPIVTGQFVCECILLKPVKVFINRMMRHHRGRRRCGFGCGCRNGHIGRSGCGLRLYVLHIHLQIVHIQLTVYLTLLFVDGKLNRGNIRLRVVKCR